MIPQFLVTDDLVEVLTDMLVCLESGNDLGATSILHEEFRDRMIQYKWIDKDVLSGKTKIRLKEKAEEMEQRRTYLRETEARLKNLNDNLNF